MTEEPTRVLFDFAVPGTAPEWQAVNDGVMGGVSDGQFGIKDSKTLAFFGTLSLANNGGFASVRTRPRNPGLRPGDVIVVRVRGDGRQYSLNLYLRRPQTAFSYRAAVPTKKDEWVEIGLPMGEFVATSFGRVVTDAGPVAPTEITAVGFMLADKMAGPFRLEVEWVKVVRAGV